MKKLKKLDIFIILTVILLITFVITMEIFFVLYREIPDTLCTCVLGSGLGELILSALIKIFSDKFENKTEG